jgi:hypothetical protein
VSYEEEEDAGVDASRRRCQYFVARYCPTLLPYFTTVLYCRTLLYHFTTPASFAGVADLS